MPQKAGLALARVEPSLHASQEMASPTPTGAVAAAHRSGKEAIMAQLPRFVRINMLKTTLGAAEKALKRTGHVLERPDRNRNKRYRRTKPDKAQNHRGYTRDPHIRELLRFLPKGKSDLSRIPLVVEGALVVQQKASCFPALALAPPTDVRQQLPPEPMLSQRWPVAWLTWPCWC
jgi:16S rRNA C967 or C1407 C5-methylase (RsmB/RsmF family)